MRRLRSTLTVEDDAVIANMRAMRMTWDAIASAFDVHRATILQHVRLTNSALLGTSVVKVAPKKERTFADRDTNPLPAGHPISWCAISASPWPGSSRTADALH